MVSHGFLPLLVEERARSATGGNASCRADTTGNLLAASRMFTRREGKLDVKAITGCTSTRNRIRFSGFRLKARRFPSICRRRRFSILFFPFSKKKARFLANRVSLSRVTLFSSSSLIVRLRRLFFFFFPFFFLFVRPSIEDTLPTSPVHSFDALSAIIRQRECWINRVVLASFIRIPLVKG